jgi:acyl-coenzyme A thioesterase PaaI-like protein
MSSIRRLQYISSGRCFQSFPRSFTTTASHNSDEEKYGGLSKFAFHLMVERAAPFIETTFKPRITHLKHGELTVTLPFNKGLVGNIRTPCLHGGVIATMLDHTAGFCGWTLLPDAFHRVSTVSLQTDYLIPPPCEDLHFEAKVEHQSSRLLRITAVCWNNDRSRKVALGHATFNVYKGSENLEDAIMQAVKARKH